jgi:hypothetical protein
MILKSIKKKLRLIRRKIATLHSMFDFDNPKKEVYGLETLCQCGYSRECLNHDSLCPECGELGLIHANLSLKEHWKYANNASKTAFVLATINTLIIGACSLFWMDLSRYCDIYIN